MICVQSRDTESQYKSSYSVAIQSRGISSALWWLYGACRRRGSQRFTVQTVYG